MFAELTSSASVVNDVVVVALLSAKVVVVVLLSSIVVVALPSSGDIVVVLAPATTSSTLSEQPCSISDTTAIRAAMETRRKDIITTKVGDGCRDPATVIRTRSEAKRRARDL